VTAFFIPGHTGDPRTVEDRYARMRQEIKREMGHNPTDRRILSLWARRGSKDCVTEVGRVDPLHGGTVLAIFDMGNHQPFVVWCEQNAETRTVLSPEAYSVLEFDA
jgi:hypothetical protein